ncbi:MAG: D-aminoacyl-tRNA deacylase [Halarsenatibacteraceae bacterium]
MRAVVQRVLDSEVKVDNKVIGSINEGLCVLLGVGNKDTKEDADYLIDKIINLRVFDDEDGKMNLSAKDLNREIMVISQFTLYGDCRSGRRPGYSEAASPGKAEKLYDYFIDKIKETELKVANGEFKAYMNVSLNNDGPVTLLIDSKKEF